MMNQKKKQKIKSLLTKLSPEPKVEVREVVKVVEKVVEKPVEKIVERVVEKKTHDLPFLVKFGQKFVRVSKFHEREMARLEKEIKAVEKKIPAMPTIPEIPKIDFAPIEKKIEDFEKDLKEELEKEKLEMLHRIGNIGRGGNANRQILIGGTDPLTKYTDINFKAGSNISISYANNETTKKVDVTITASSTMGGTVRSINTINTSQSVGSVAGTDYVYIASAGVNVILPDANANKNLYTVKNVSNSSVLISTIGGQNIDNDTNVIMPIKFTSVDLISDGINTWNIT